MDGLAVLDNGKISTYFGDRSILVYLIEMPYGAGKLIWWKATSQ